MMHQTTVTGPLENAIGQGSTPVLTGAQTRTGLTWLVRAAIVILYPRTEGLPGAEDCDLDAFLARFRRESPMLLWVGVVMGSVLFHLMPIVTVKVPLPAFLLSESLADRHADRVSKSGVYLIRQSVFMVKFAAGLAWGAHADVRRRFALPPLAADPGTWRTT